MKGIGPREPVEIGARQLPRSRDSSAQVMTSFSSTRPARSQGKSFISETFGLVCLSGNGAASTVRRFATIQGRGKPRTRFKRKLCMLLTRTLQLFWIVNENDWDSQEWIVSDAD